MPRYLVDFSRCRNRTTHRLPVGAPRSYRRAVKVNDLLALTEARRMATSGLARRIRVDAGISLQEMASTIGVSHVTVHRWELGARTPRGKPGVRYKLVLDSVLRMSKEG